MSTLGYELPLVLCLTNGTYNEVMILFCEYQTLIALEVILCHKRAVTGMMFV